MSSKGLHLFEVCMYWLKIQFHQYFLNKTMQYEYAADQYMILHISRVS